MIYFFFCMTNFLNFIEFPAVIHGVCVGVNYFLELSVSLFLISCRKSVFSNSNLNDLNVA